MLVIVISLLQKLIIYYTVNEIYLYEDENYRDVDYISLRILIKYGVRRYFNP